MLQASIGCGDDTLELEVLNELSKARSNPAAVAESIRERLQHFKGSEYYPPDRGGKTAVVTKEGVYAVRDAIAFLEKQAKLPPLSGTCSQGLLLAAEDHLLDLGSRGAVGHQGADGSSSSDRMKRYGTWSGKCGECLWFGRMRATAKQIVEDLIVDDGVPSRGHRLGIYDSAFHAAGVRMGSHKTFGACCVMDFATQFNDNEDKIIKRVTEGPPTVRAGAAVKTQWRNLGTCPGCNEMIHGGAVMEALGHKWHKDCFACQAEGCGKSLRGVPYQEHGGMPFCKDCYFEKFGSICNGCGAKIHGGVMKAMGHTWHKECFVCGECGGQLDARFAKRNGKPLCGKCASAPIAAGYAGKRNASQPGPARAPAPAPRTSRPRTPPRTPPQRTGHTPPPVNRRSGSTPAVAAARPKAAMARNTTMRAGGKGATVKQTPPKTVPIAGAKKTFDALAMNYADLE